MLKCPSCEAVFEESELQNTYNCTACGTEFTRGDSADGDSNRCPDCNKFAALSDNKACPECEDVHEESEFEEVEDEDDEDED